jgi:acyl carrier protein
MDQLVALMAECLRLPTGEITPELSIENSDAWDSLKHMEVVLSIEQAFDIRLTADEIVAMVSVGEIHRVLREKGVLN